MFTEIYLILMFCFAFDFSLWGPFHVVLFNTIVFLLAMAHLKAVCSDPGVVPLPQNRVDFSDIHSGLVWLFMILQINNVAFQCVGSNLC